MKINPQIDNEISKCVQALRSSTYVIFPDETGWSIGCDAANESLVQQITVSDAYSDPAVLLDDQGKLTKYVKEIPDPVWDLVEFSIRPLQLVLGNVLNLPKAVFNENNEVAFRIVKDDFAKRMCHKFGKPVFVSHISNPDNQTRGAGMILNTPAYTVNLRISSGANPQSLVIIRLSAGGRIEFIKK